MGLLFWRRVIPYLESGLFDKLDAPVEFSELVVAPARVCEYFDAVEAHEDVWAIDNTNE